MNPNLNKRASAKHASLKLKKDILKKLLFLMNNLFWHTYMLQCSTSPKKINNTDYMAQITLHILMTRFFAAYSDNNNGYICLIHQKTSCTAYSTHSGALFYYLLGLLEASVSGSTCLCCILYHSFILILKCWVTSGMGHDVF